MSNEEKIQHKQTYIEYLKQLTSGLEKEIWDLQHLQVDPYAELKSAHASGKRIAVLQNVRGIKEYKFLEVPHWDGIVKHYKVVEGDETDISPDVVFGCFVRTKYTKCALTGKITAEVVE